MKSNVIKIKFFAFVFLIVSLFSLSCRQKKIERIIIKDKTIVLNQRNEKMTALIEPKEATQTVTWTSENTSIVDIAPTTGLLIPIAAGRTTIIATSTEDSTKVGKATVTVLVPITSFNIKSIEPPSIYYGRDATITFETAPSGVSGNFIFLTDNKDIEFVETKEQNKYKIKVKNESASETTATFTVQSRVALSLPAQKGFIHIKSIAPTSLVIEGDDKISSDEKLEFKVKANDEMPSLNASVEWKIEEADPYGTNNAPLEQIQLEKLDWGSSVNVGLLGDKSKLIGKSFKIVAISTLDKSITAEKFVEICKKLADIKNVECNCTEYTLCSSEKNDGLYNKGKNIDLKIKLNGNVEDQHLEFFVSEKENINGKTEQNMHVFQQSILSITENDFDPKTNVATIKLAPHHNTKGKQMSFLLHPIDPKTGMPCMDENKSASFKLLVWDEPIGIEIKEGNFRIYEGGDRSYKSETIRYKNSGYTFSVRMIPRYANPNYLEWRVGLYSGNHMCIQYPSCSKHYDQDGEYTVTFSTNNKNTFGSHDYAYFNFFILIPDENGTKQTLSVPVENYLMIDSN